jgi:hypothetical protein
MAGIHTGKQKAQRIDLAYHRRTDAFRSWRNYLTVVAVVGALGYAAFGLFAGPAGEVQFTHGPLSAPHAHIDRNCAACHEPFAPIRDDSLLSQWPKIANRLFGSPAKAESWGRVSDAKCTTCHQETLGHHGQLSKAEDISSCASCHIEHRGRDVDVALSSDKSCLRCHDKLDDHRLPLTAELVSAGGAEPIASHVGRFYDDHPEFRSLKPVAGALTADPGTLKTFSHAQHLGLGIFFNEEGKKPSEEGVLKKWSYVDKTLGTIQKPAGESEDALIQLNCQSCHQPDAGLATKRGGQASSAGEFMSPVTFARHCSGCHQRDLPKGVSHGLTAGEVASQLKVSLAEEMSKGELKAGPDKQAPGPGLGIGPQLKALAAIDLSSEAFKARREDTRLRCGKCHQMNPAEPDALPQVKPASIPATWLAHGRFNHAAHTTIKCDDCHGGAAKSQKGDDVSIENKNSCVNCHRPANSGVPGSGARHECGLCHVFHVGPENYGTTSGSSSLSLLREMPRSRGLARRNTEQATEVVRGILAVK